MIGWLSAWLNRRAQMRIDELKKFQALVDAEAGRARHYRKEYISALDCVSEEKKRKNDLSVRLAGEMARADQAEENLRKQTALRTVDAGLFQQKIDALQQERMAFLDLVPILLQRGFSAVELSQLGLGTLQTLADGSQRFVSYDLDDLKTLIDSGERGKMNEAKFRTFKTQFRMHQEAVGALVRRLHKLARKNVLLAADVQEARDLSIELGRIIGRDLWAGGDK